MQKKKKLVVVEDDELNQLAYSGVLSKFYDVIICGSDKEFYLALTNNSYDLFIINLALNCEKDGLDLIKELRLMKEYKKTPIIVVTAYAFKRDEINSLAAGANKFITKPFSNKTLLEEIENMFK